MSIKPHKQRFNVSAEAFTLVELLLACLIFSIIALSLYNMFASGLKLDTKARYIHQTYHQAQLSFELLTKELENAIYYDFSGSYPQQVALNGQEDQLRLILPTEDGIKVIRYYLGVPDTARITKTVIGGHSKSLKRVVVDSKEKSLTRVLIREEQSLINFMAKAQEGIDKEVVATGIQEGGLKCQYASYPKDLANAIKGDQPELIWGSSWTNQALPAAVKVTLTLQGQGPLQEGVVLTRDIFLPMGEKQ